METNDLIYEGIATTNSFLEYIVFQRNKRPDLRRDCDKVSKRYEKIRSVKQTTWFTKGLRRFIKFYFRLVCGETNDLIYEGIATGNYLMLSTFSGRGNESNDLIYEGIATFHRWYNLPE